MMRLVLPRRRLSAVRAVAGSAIALLAGLLVLTEANTRHVKAERDQSAAVAYAAQIALAQRELAAHNFRRARELLTATALYPQRGLEWDYLDTGCPQATLPLVGHTGEIIAVAFSPDGATLATAAKDATVRLWNLADQAKNRVFRGRAAVSTLAFSPDGRTIAAGDEQGNLLLLEAATLAARPFRADQDAANSDTGVRSLAYSPDGSLLAVADSANQFLLWDTKTRHVVYTQPFPFGSVMALVFAPTGDRLAVTGGSGTIFFDAIHGKVTAAVSAAPCVYRTAAFAPDGKRLVVADWDGAATVLDTKTGEALGSLSAPTGYASVPTESDPAGMLRYSAIAFDADGTRIVAGSNDGSLRFWDAATFKPTGYLPGHKGRVSSLSVARGDDRIAAVGSDESVIVWRPRRIARLQMFSNGGGQNGPITQLALSPDGKYIVTVSDDGIVFRQDAATGRSQRLFTMPFPSPLTISSDSRRVLYSNGKGQVMIRGMEADKTFAVLSHPNLGPDITVASLAMSPNARRVYAATGSNRVLAWDIRADGQYGTSVDAMPPHSGPVYNLCLTPDGSRLLTSAGGNRGTLFVWRTGSNYLEDRYSLPYGPITTLATAPNGEYFAAGHASGTITLWSLEERGEKRLLHTLSGESGINTLTFSPDSTRLATVDAAGTLTLWDATSGQRLLSLPPTETGSAATAATFLPDGSLLLGGADGRLRVLRR